MTRAWHDGCGLMSLSKSLLRLGIISGDRVQPTGLCANVSAGVDQELAQNLHAVRGALSRYIAEACYLDVSVSKQNDPLIIEQISRIRAGRLDKLRWMYFLQEADPGTASEPLKGLRKESRSEALVKISNIFDDVIAIYTIAAPRDAPDAIKFFGRLKHMLQNLVDLGVAWSVIDKHMSTIMRLVSNKARSYALGEAAHSGADFSLTIFDGGTALMKQVQKDEMAQLAANAARSELKRTVTAAIESSDDEQEDGVVKTKKKPKKKPKKEKQPKDKPKVEQPKVDPPKKEPRYAAGVTPGTPVPFPGVDADAAKAFLLAHPPVDVVHNGTVTKKRVCWGYFHPQGCSRAKCHFAHP